MAASSASILAEVPDPTNLGNRPQQLVSIGAAFLSITWLAVLLRVWARSIIIKTFGWDDWTMLITIVRKPLSTPAAPTNHVKTAFTCQCGYIIRMGLVEMRPVERLLNLEAIGALVTDVIAFTGCYVITTIFLKISLALFFLRIIIRPWERRVIIVSLVVYTVFSLAYFGVAVLGCGNPAHFIQSLAAGKCVSIQKLTIPMSYLQTSLNAVMDWIFVILPIRTLWGLKMPTSTKCWASGLIMLGALGSIASLIRLTTVKGLSPGREFFRDSAPTAIWATIEPGLGIAAASFATLRPMFRRCIESTRTGYSAGHSDMVMPGGNRGAIHSNGVPLGLRSSAERAGFRPFGSLDSDVELDSVHIEADPEKSAPEKGTVERRMVERSPEGIWVHRTTVIAR